MGIAKYHGKRKCLEFFVFVCLCFFFLLFFFCSLLPLLLLLLVLLRNKRTVLFFLLVYLCFVMGYWTSDLNGK